MSKWLYLSSIPQYVMLLRYSRYLFTRLLSIATKVEMRENKWNMCRFWSCFIRYIELNKG